jgi:hypothetical protein
LAEDIIKFLKQNKPDEILDIIAMGIKLFFSNIGFILLRIFIPQLMLLFVGGYIILTSGFQFNYSYINSKYGLQAGAIVFLLFIIIQSIAKIQLSSKFFYGNYDLGVRDKIFNGINIVIKSIISSLFLIISIIVLTAFLILPGLINLIFPISNTYFHLSWIHQYKRVSFPYPYPRLLNQLRYFWRRAYLVGLVSRLAILLSSAFLFISLIFFAEFWRVFLGGALFLFFEERISTLEIFAAISILFFLFFSTITYFCFIIFYDFVSLRKEGFYLKTELNKNISDDTSREKD